MTAEYQWASHLEAHGMPHPDELEREGFRQVGTDPRYEGTVLMRRDVDEVTE